MLVSNLVELARGTRQEDDVEDVRLDELALEAVEWMRLHAPDTTFETNLEPTVVRASRRRVERAIRNLLDNAVKWNEDGRPIEVAVCGGELIVRDHGPEYAPRTPPASSTVSTARPKRAPRRARGSGSRSSVRSLKRTAEV